MVSQIIWYLIEGRNHRLEIKSFDDVQYFNKIFVPSDMTDFIFYQNVQTDQWWIEINEKNGRNKIIPCSKSDYSMAVAGEIPTKWWKYFKKFF